MLVRLPNWLGDVLMARPLLHALRAAWPQAQFLGVGPAPLLALPALEGLIEQGVPWPRDASARREARARVRAWAPETALVLPASFSSAWLAYTSGARVRVGYRAEWRQGLLTYAPVRRPRGERHLSDEFLDLVSPLGVSEVATPVLLPREEERGRARALLAESGVSGEERVAIIGPRSAYGPAREWFTDRFVAAGRALASRGLRVLVCGTPPEAAACAAVASGIGPAAVSLAGRTDLPVLTALAAGARLALCNDSGLAHLAAATGAPTIQIYGSASSGWTAARGPHVRVLHRAPVCSPCWRRTCRIGTKCLDAVSVAWVLREAERLMEEAA